MKRPLQRTAAITTMMLSILWWSAGPAAAHVLLAKAQPNPDGTTTLTFSFDHGCGESPTTGLTVTVPQGVTAKTAAAPPGWTASATATQATFSGTPIAAGTQAEFLVTVTITGTSAGQALAFPATQACESGETLAWQDTRPSAEHPAPSLIVTAAMLPLPQRSDTPQGASLPAVVLGLTVLAALAAAAGYAAAKRSAD